MSAIPSRAKAEQVAANAQALVDALGTADHADREIVIEDLELAALEWSADADMVQRFSVEGQDIDLPEASPLDVLSVASVDLQVAEVLLAAGLAADEVGAGVDGRGMLQSSVNRLEVELATGDTGDAGATAGFGAGAAPPWVEDDKVDVATAARAAIDTVVDGCLEVLENAKAGLAELVPDVLVKALQAFDDLLDSAPQVGRLIKQGLRALKRALLMLQELVPAGVRTNVREYAERWWTEHQDDIQRAVVARTVGASQAQAAVDEANQSEVPAEVTRNVREALGDLVDRFERLTATFGRVLKGLTAAVAVAAIAGALLPPVSVWVGPAGAVGYLLVAGSVLLFARDYLDTGPLASVDGVQNRVRDLVAG